MDKEHAPVYIELETYKGISVNDFVTTEWKGYFKVIKIQEAKIWNKFSKTTYTNTNYHVRYVCSEEGIPSKSKTKIRKTNGWGVIRKVTPELIEKWRLASENKWKNLSDFMFPEEEKAAEEKEITNPYLKPLGSSLLRED